MTDNPHKPILDAIEAARRAGTLNNDAARAASVALGLTGDEAMLACRLVAQGSDPASLEYVADGEVSAPIAHAHRNGPGSLTGDDRRHWLRLAGLSVDESKPSTLRERVIQFAESLRIMGVLRSARESQAIESGADRVEAEIASLPYRTANVGGRTMRVYEGDLGYAAAYWAGEPCAAVVGTFNGEPYIGVGSNGTPLADLGVTVDKPLAPCFGIIEDPEAVAAIKGASD